MDKTKYANVNVALPVGMQARADECATERMMTRNELIRDALRKYLDEWDRNRLRNKDVNHLERSLGE